ncbi:MAG: sugar ABC transporter ATP-binding protein [Actinomycetaceae bacterium]|nr:sugar ABC transporter ATP-binding protein [Actinomycetaceae bacterium]
MPKTETPEAQLGLVAQNVAKYYSGVPALSGVSVQCRPGEIVGLVGHNGAGKSTLLKIFSGAHRHDEGHVYLDGREVHFSSPAEAISNGVATVYQELSLLQNLSVTENTFLGRELRGLTGINKDLMRIRTQELMDKFQIDVDVDRQVGDYPVATRQLMEIAIATTLNTRYLLLDEPTTALEGEQVESLLDYVKQVSAKENLGVVIVNHKLDELYRIADRIVALVDGQVRIDANAKEVPHDAVVEAIAGVETADEVFEGIEIKASKHALTKQKGQTTHVNGEKNQALVVKDLHTPSLNGVNIEIHEGEVLGLYGLVGAGRTEFLRTLLGLDKIKEGSLELFGQPYIPKNPKDAGKRGLVYLTEERKKDGIIPMMNGLSNVSLPVVGRYCKLGWLSRRSMDRESRGILDSLQIRGNIFNDVTSLSGGNQQKVLLARAITQRPRILMLDEPTKGVDIGVKAEIHRLLKTMAHESGLAVLVVSSEDDEIIEVSDRVSVFVSGRTVGESIPVEELNTSRLRQLAWGAEVSVNNSRISDG